MKKYKLISILISMLLLLTPFVSYAVETEPDPTNPTEPTPTTSPEPTETPEPSPSPSPSPTPTTSPEPSETPVEVKISLNKTELSLTVGEKYKLVATTEGTTAEVEWTTGNANIATVSNGNIIATGAGETTITAKVGDKTATCKVVVKAKQTETQKKLEYTLSKVTIKNGEISPEFKKDTTKYTVKIGKDVTSLDLVYSLTDDKNDVQYFTNGNSNLKNGDTVKIIISDKKDGTVKNTYEFKIAKEEVNLKLKSLKITGYALNEEFDANKLSYTATIPYSIDTLSIQAVADSKDNEVTYSGNTNLKVGVNTVKVTVKDNKGNSSVYEIKVTRSEEDKVDENKTSIITSSLVSSSKPTDSKTDDTSSGSSDDFLKYFIVSFACLLLFAIGGIGIYFYIKTSPRRLKKELKNLKNQEPVETPMVEVNNNQTEQLETENKIEVFDEVDLMATKQFKTIDLNDMIEELNEKDEEDV